MILDRSRLDSLEPELERDFSRLQQKLAADEARMERIRESLDRIPDSSNELSGDRLYQRLEQEVVFAISGLLASLNSDLLDLSLVQARARSDAIDLIPVDLDMNLALQIAAINRRDWMNAGHRLSIPGGRSPSWRTIWRLSSILWPTAIWGRRATTRSTSALPAEPYASEWSSTPRSHGCWSETTIVRC